MYIHFNVVSLLGKQNIKHIVMGFFSWKTQDTSKSIANHYSRRKTFGVWLLDDKGNKWFEPNYEGYGMFGGKDFYVLLAEMNGFYENQDVDPDMEYGRLRDEGIRLAFSGKKFKSPNLVQHIQEWEYKEDEPKSCEYQGYFY